MTITTNNITITLNNEENAYMCHLLVTEIEESKRELRSFEKDGALPLWWASDPSEGWDLPDLLRCDIHCFMRRLRDLMK